MGTRPLGRDNVIRVSFKCNAFSVAPNLRGLRFCEPRKTKNKSARIAALDRELRKRKWQGPPEACPRELEQDGLSYRVHNVVNAEFVSKAMAGLQKKGADISYISELCSAAEAESGHKMKQGTKDLARRKTERRFHQFFGRSLPKVSSLEIPLLVSKKKKKVAKLKCSSSALS